MSVSKQLCYLCAILAVSFFSFPMFGQTTTPGNNDVIIAQEAAFWKAYVAANTEDLSKLFAPDFVNVEEQVMNAPQVLRFVSRFHERCTLAPVSILNPRVTLLSSDVATVVYHAIETPTCGSQTMSGDTNISTVWVRRGDRWQMHLHTEYATAPRLWVPKPVEP
jgi:Domain of unknown function (DUF4440)